MIHFRFFGIPVEIQPFFWVIMALLGSSYGADSGVSNQALAVCLFVIAGAISIFVHELGHALTGKFFGAHTYIVLHGFGGYAAFPDARFTRWQGFLVTFAGPVAQLLVAVIAFSLLRMKYAYSADFIHFLGALLLVSVFWAIINLIPTSPLDGGQMLNAALGQQRRKLTLMISMGSAVLFSLLMLKMGIFMFPIILLVYAYQNYQEYRLYP